MTDVSRSLRDEERQAWQLLIRVIGHEINNSLAPIKSIANSLERLLVRDPKPADWEGDMRDGLQVIGGRAESLGRFTAAYAQLARLPAPTIEPVPLQALVARVAGLERRLAVRVDGGPKVIVHADADQLEQLLINLVRNAADAALVTAGGVHVGWGLPTAACVYGWRTKGQGCRIRRTCSCRSSRPSREARVSGWYCAGRLPKPTANRDTG